MFLNELLLSFRYRVQAKQWPQNPLDDFISQVQVRTTRVWHHQQWQWKLTINLQANPSWVVADLGCGDARLRKRCAVMDNCVTHLCHLMLLDVAL